VAVQKCRDPAEASSSAKHRQREGTMPVDPESQGKQRDNHNDDQLKAQIDPVTGQLEPVSFDNSLLPFALRSNTERLIPFNGQTDLLRRLKLRRRVYLI
jgi:hypothetical protein